MRTVRFDRPMIARALLTGLSALLTIAGGVLIFLLILAWTGVIHADRANFGQKTVEVIALGGGAIIAGILIFLQTDVRNRLDDAIGNRPKG